MKRKNSETVIICLYKNMDVGYFLVLQVDELQATRELEDEDDEDAADFEGIPEDTDEEYVPAAESGSISPSAPAACKRRAECKADRAENGEAVGDDAKKDSVQCPVCDKTFKSKYYLKVHNR